MASMLSYVLQTVIFVLVTGTQAESIAHRQGKIQNHDVAMEVDAHGVDDEDASQNAMQRLMRSVKSVLKQPVDVVELDERVKEKQNKTKKNKPAPPAGSVCTDKKGTCHSTCAHVVGGRQWCYTTADRKDSTKNWCFCAAGDDDEMPEQIVASQTRGSAIPVEKVASGEQPMEPPQVSSEHDVELVQQVKAMSAKLEGLQSTIDERLGKMDDQMKQIGGRMAAKKNETNTSDANLTDSEVLPEEPKDVKHGQHKAAGAFVFAIVLIIVVLKRALAQRKQFADSSRELLPSKSVVVVTGWMLKTSISLTLLSMLLNRGTARKKEGTGDSNSSTDANGGSVAPGPADMAIHFVTFLVLLAMAVGLSQFVKKTKLLFENTKQLYVLGLALIPAWAWKDFISHLITVITNHRLAADESLHRAPPLFNMMLALLVIIISSSIQIGAEMVSKTADDESSLVFLIANTLKQCMGLGAGFAVNNIFKTAFRQSWSKLWFQAIYGFVQFSTIPPAQHWINQRFKESTTFVARIAKFFAVAGNFVIGWAVKGLLDAVFHGLEDDGQLLATLVISTLCIAAVTSASTLENPVMRTLVNTSAAMNIGWTWTDWISGVQSQDPKTTIGAIWLDMFIVTVLMLGLACIFEKLINCIHPPHDENEGEDGVSAAASQQPEQPATNDAEQPLAPAAEDAEQPSAAASQQPEQPLANDAEQPSAAAASKQPEQPAADDAEKPSTEPDKLAQASKQPEQPSSATASKQPEQPAADDAEKP